MKRIVPIAATVAAIAAVPALVAGAGAQSAPPSGTLELVQRERDVRAGFVDNPPRRRESAGDVFTVTGPVRDAAGRRAGTVQAVFTQTRRRGAHGAVTFLLSGGRITAVGALAGSGTDDLAIAGGTGTYAKAAGTVTITEAEGETRFRFAF